MLHHRQQMAEMLAMVAASPAKDRSLVGWSGQFGLRQHGRNRHEALAFADQFYVLREHIRFVRDQLTTETSSA